MRVTNNMLTNGYLNNLSKNLNKMQTLQQRGTTGKAVSKPSDNPVLISKIMTLKNNIVENENYNNTIHDAQAFTSAQDTALDGAAKSMRKIRDLTISAAKGSLSQVDRDAIKAEIESEVNTLKDVLNSSFDGRYIFGGQKTGSKPFEFNDNGEITYNGDENNISREVSKGINVELMTNGNKLAEKDGEKLGAILNDLLKDVGSMDSESIEKLSDEHIVKLDKQLDNLVSVRTQIGAIDNRLEAAKARNESENISLKDMLSQKEDVDIIENYMESTLMSTVYQASLSAGAKILQPSLLDYLR